MKALAAAMILAAVAASADAATVFDNGPPNGAGSNQINDNFVAANFALRADKTLTGATFFLTASNDQGETVSPRDVPILYQLWSDRDGRPGDLLQSGAAENLRYSGTDRQTRLSFDFRDAQAALAGVTYWFVLTAVDVPGVRRTDWLLSDFRDGVHLLNSPDDVRFEPDTNPFDVAFSLQDASAAVPEPAAWALMILGFGAAGARLRRRRRGALAV